MRLLLHMIIPVALLAAGCGGGELRKSDGPATRFGDPNLPPAQVAQLDTLPFAVRIGPYMVPRQDRQHSIEVPAGSYAVKVEVPGQSHPEFEWQAVGGEKYSLGMSTRHLASDSAIHLYYSSPTITHIGSSPKIVGSPIAGAAFELRDAGRLYPPDVTMPDAAIELQQGLELTGLSGQTADGKRVTCAEGKRWFTELASFLTPGGGRGVPTAACGVYVKERKLRVLPGAYTIEVVIKTHAHSGGPLMAAVQVEPGETATLAPEIKSQLVGPAQVRLSVTKARGM